MVLPVRQAFEFARLRLGRAGKYCRQRLDGRRVDPAALFVVGCQRSGTTMLLHVLERSPDTWIYHEYDGRAFDDWKLRPLEVRRRLLQRARCRWVVFKSLYDSQNIDRLLAEQPDSRAVWLFRRYQDVVISSSRKWGERLPLVIHRLATESECDHWMADRLPPERRRLLADLDHPDLSIATAAALRWYLRNEVYFDRGLQDRRDRVLPLRYEDLVQRPLESFRPVFSFLELEFSSRYVSRVSPGSVREGCSVTIEPPVEALCEDLTARFLAAATPSA
jgi:hypothetical protein